MVSHGNPIAHFFDPPPLDLHDSRHPHRSPRPVLGADVDSPVADCDRADGERFAVGGGADAGVGQEGVVANLKIDLSINIKDIE